MLALGLAGHLVVLFFADEAIGAPSLAAVGALLLLGLTGLVYKRSPVLTVRAVAVVATAWPAAIAVHGVGAAVTMWFAAALLMYPLLVTRSLVGPFLALGVASHVGLMLLSSSAAPIALATQAVLLAGAGGLAWLLRVSTERLAGEREQAESEARRAQGRFRAAFANASSGMAMIDLDGRIIQANQALGDFLSRPVGELHDTPWFEAIHPDEREGVMSRVNQLTNTEIWSFQQEVRYLLPEDRVVWGLLGVSLVTDDSGVPVYLFAHVQDITERMRTEQQLRTSEEHYRNLFGRSPVAIWELDFSRVGAWLSRLAKQGVTDVRAHFRARPDVLRDGVDLIEVEDVNDAAVTLVEAAAREDLLRGLPSQMLTPETLDALAEQFAAVWEDRDRVESGAASSTLRGRKIDLIMHWVAPVVAGRLDLSKVVMACADITEYRQTQEALRRIEERLRTVVGAAPIILFALDRHGVLTLTEGEGLASLSLTSGEAVGRSIFELFRDAPQLIRSVRRALAGEAFTTSVEIRHLHFDTRFTPIWEDGRVAGVVGVANDVTERTQASERLEQLVRSKDEFVASVSHELRTPLTAVVGFAQELRTNMPNLERSDIDSFVGLIAEQSLEVADLVEDLLVAARVDLGNVAVAPEPVVVREQVDAVLSAWPQAEADRVVITGDQVKAFADPVRLRQILRNLLTNAQRYGGATIGIDVRGDAELAWITVSDDGPGIPENDREKIFEPYHRAHRFQGQPASVGLGLTVSRQLARLMGGDLNYRYEEDVSIFELTLPSVG